MVNWFEIWLFPFDLVNKVANGTNLCADLRGGGSGARFTVPTAARCGGNGGGGGGGGIGVFVAVTVVGGVTTKLDELCFFKRGGTVMEISDEDGL